MLFFFGNVTSNAQSGIFESYVILNNTSESTFYDLQTSSVSDDLEGILILNGTQNKVYEIPYNNSVNLRAITNCPSPISQNVDSGICSAVVTFTLPITDIPNYSMVLTSALGNGDPFPVGITTVTYVERDDNGVLPDVGTFSFDVTVIDNESPIADAASLSDITAECEVTTLTAPTATDNCGGTVIVTHDATLPISGENTTTIVT